MLLPVALAAAAANASATPPEMAARPVVVAHATASVRIVSGVRLKLDSETNPDAPPARVSKVLVNGEERPAKLIEFE